MWKVTFSREAIKSLSKVDVKYKKNIVEFLSDLENWSNNFDRWDIKKLKGLDNSFRCRVGVYRIVFKVYKKEIEIEVVKIGQRKDIYN